MVENVRRQSGGLLLFGSLGIANHMVVGSWDGVTSGQEQITPAATWILRITWLPELGIWDDITSEQEQSCRNTWSSKVLE